MPAGIGGLIPAHAGKTLGLTVDHVIPRAHPRSRGENRRPLVRPERRMGSSPLTRGKLNEEAEAFQKAGLIPAHAGKTSRSPCARTSPTAHPRSRGENCEYWPMMFTYQGSSPLTRGKRVGRSPENHARRLIPAHAGKTRRLRPRRRGARAHPRSRGENLRAISSNLSGSGSSPLTRGKRSKRRMNQ